MVNIFDRLISKSKGKNLTLIHTIATIDDAEDMIDLYGEVPFFIIEPVPTNSTGYDPSEYFTTHVESVAYTDCSTGSLNCTLCSSAANEFFKRDDLLGVKISRLRDILLFGKYIDAEGVEHKIKKWIYSNDKKNIIGFEHDNGKAMLKDLERLGFSFQEGLMIRNKEISEMAPITILFESENNGKLVKPKEEESFPITDDTETLPKNLTPSSTLLKRTFKAIHEAQKLGIKNLRFGNLSKLPAELVRDIRMYVRDEIQAAKKKKLVKNN